MTFSIVARDNGQWGVAVASKFLAVGAAVPAAQWNVGAIADAYQRTKGPLAQRLTAALLVVSGAGGYGGGSDVLVDLRVDDHTDPVPELQRLLELHGLYFGKPTDVLPLEGDLAVEVADRLARLGYSTLEDWAGVENFEERMVPGGIDVLVLEQLRK